jgi:hypothetical protein
MFIIFVISCIYRVLKVSEQVGCELAELAMVTMEAVGNEIKVDRICKAASEWLSVQVSHQGCWYY